MDIIIIIIICGIVIGLLGLVVAFSPTLVLTEIAVLTKSQKPLIHSVALITGIASAVALFCIITAIFVDPSKDFSLPWNQFKLSSVPLIDIIAGILLIELGRRLLSKPATKNASTSKFNPSKIMTTRSLYWFGLLKMATSLSSIAAIVYASRFVKTYLDKESQQVIALVWLLIIAIVPFLLLVGIKLFRPGTFQNIQNASDRVTAISWRRYAIIASFCAGGLLIVMGLSNLN